MVQPLWKPVPLPDGSYADDCKPWSDQDVCNYIPVFAESSGTTSRVLLRDLPGLRHVKTIGTGPIRCSVNVQGKRLIVSGTKLYQWKSDDDVIQLGVVPGTGRVVPIFNQITGGNQVLFLNGSSGYVYNTVTGAYAQVTDPGFPGGITGDYINQLAVVVEPGRRFWLNSALADETDFNALERYEGEADPDLIVSIRSIHNQVCLLNEETCEFFDNTGLTNAIFQNTKVTVERGCASSFCVETLDNSLFFVGNDGNVYRFNGYIPQRISTHAIEQDLARSNLSKCFSYTWEERGHKVYYITCPDGHTWGYDVSSGRWHRRASCHDGRVMDRWRLNTLFKWNGDYYGGEFNSGRIFRLDWDYMLEGADEHIRSFTPPNLHNNGNRMQLHGIRFDVDTGGPVSVYEPLPPPLVYTWWLTQGHVSPGVKSRLWRNTDALDGWWPAEGISRTRDAVAEESLLDTQFLGLAVVSQHADGDDGMMYDHITELSPEGLTIASPATAVGPATNYPGLRRDIVDLSLAYGPTVYTTDFGLTMHAMVQPAVGVLTSEKLDAVVRLNSGRWLGSGQSTLPIPSGVHFCYTDEAIPTTWIALGDLFNDTSGQYPSLIDVSTTSVIVAGAASGTLRRSTDNATTWTDIHDITGQASFIKCLGGPFWIASTFDAWDVGGSGDRIWISSDDGATWTESTDSAQLPAGRYSFAFGGSNLLLFACVLTDAGPPALWKSSDFGWTWTQVALPSAFLSGMGTASCMPLMTHSPG